MITIKLIKKFNSNKVKGGLSMKLVAKVLAVIGAVAATVGTTGCSFLICDEPKMPKSLLNK